MDRAGIRQNQWKLVQQSNKPWQLYDLSKDRTETRDLASIHSGRAKKLQEVWEEWAKGVGVNQKLKMRKFGVNLSFLIMKKTFHLILPPQKPFTELFRSNEATNGFRSSIQ